MLGEKTSDFSHLPFNLFSLFICLKWEQSVSFWEKCLQVGNIIIIDVYVTLVALDSFVIFCGLIWLIPALPRMVYMHASFVNWNSNSRIIDNWLQEETRKSWLHKIVVCQAKPAFVKHMFYHNDSTLGHGSEEHIFWCSVHIVNGMEWHQKASLCPFTLHQLQKQWRRPCWLWGKYGFLYPDPPVLLFVPPKLAQSVSHTTRKETSLCSGAPGCGLPHVGHRVA